MREIGWDGEDNASGRKERGSRGHRRKKGTALQRNTKATRTGSLQRRVANIVRQQVHNHQDHSRCNLVIEGPVYFVDWKVWDLLQCESTVVYWCGFGMLTANGRSFHGAHGVCSLLVLNPVHFLGGKLVWLQCSCSV